MKVHELAIGGGPPLYKWEHNGTVYSLRCFPFMGFVRIAGLEGGAVLRPAPQTGRIAVTLSAIGNTQRVYWLIDGDYSQVSKSAAPVRVVFTENGTHAITAFDADGRHHRIEIVVKGLPPPA